MTDALLTWGGKVAAVISSDQILTTTDVYAARGRYRLVKMDLQDLLCGMTAAKLRPFDMQKPNLDRFRELRRSLSHRARRAGEVGFARRFAAHHRASKIRRGGKGQRPGRRKRLLPSGSGPLTVGCVDLMSDHTVSGLFLRLYYPTESRDVFVSRLIHSYFTPQALEMWIL